jgi:hypothetical protein
LEQTSLPQSWPHAPQLARSFAKSLQAAPQALKPAKHPEVQVPLSQRLKPFATAGAQVTPVGPQVFGLFRASMQRFSLGTSAKPGMQGVAQ